jgi:hypothetical protein
MIDPELQEQRIRRTLRAVADRTVVAPALEEPWLGRSRPPSHRPSRVLVGVAAVVVIVAGISVAIAYGPRSSDIGGSGRTNLASYPKVAVGWAVPTPAGFVRQSRDQFGNRYGIQTFNDAARGAAYGNRDVLRRDGWKSGIAEAWAPKKPAAVILPPIITIDLSIDQFDSPRHAADFQSTAESSFKELVPDGAHLKLMTFGGIPGAVIEQTPGASDPSQKLEETVVEITFHRGPYVVQLSATATSTNTVGTTRHLVEKAAQEEYGRLPH